MNTDRLAHIEANAVAYLTDDVYDDAWEHAREITDRAAPDLRLGRDVLALVEIAKAARALQADSFGDAPAWEALDAALARLDSGATEGDV